MQSIWTICQMPYADGRCFCFRCHFHSDLLNISGTPTCAYYHRHCPRGEKTEMPSSPMLQKKCDAAKPKLCMSRSRNKHDESFFESSYTYGHPTRLPWVRSEIIMPAASTFRRNVGMDVSHRYRAGATQLPWPVDHLVNLPFYAPFCI